MDIKETNSTDLFSEPEKPDFPSDMPRVENIDGMINQDLKQLAKILIDIRDDEKKEMMYAKRQSIMSLVISALCLFIVICVAVAVISVIPRVNKLIVTANAVIVEAQDMMDDANSTVKNLNEITTELNKLDMDKLFGEVDELVVTSQEEIENAMGKLNSIDFDGLNTAITDLTSVIDPLAKLFGKKR